MKLSYLQFENHNQSAWQHFIKRPKEHSKNIDRSKINFISSLSPFSPSLSLSALLSHKCTELGRSSVILKLKGTRGEIANVQIQTTSSEMQMQNSWVSPWNLFF